MIRSRFFWKLYTGYAMLILLSIGIVGALVGFQMRRDTIADIRGSLRSNAALLRGIVMAGAETDPPLPYQELVDNFRRNAVALGKEVPVRLTLILADGTVIADSEKDPALMDNHRERPEVVEAAGSDSGVGESRRFSMSVDRDMMYLALRVDRGDRVWGFVRASYPLEALDEKLAQLRGVVLLGAILTAVLALGLGYVVSRRVMAPLKAMIPLAVSIAEGDYHQRVDSYPDDEMGKFANAFNAMAAQLEERMETILSDRNKLVTILGGMVEGVVAVDREERIVHMNDVAGKFLGVTPEKSVGEYSWKMIRIRKISETLAATLREARDVKQDVRLVSWPRDLFIEMTASPLRDGEGRLMGAVVVLHDVTELRRLESIRRDFVANVSHELKTPITVIRGLAETLVEDEDAPPDTRRRFLKKINNQALRLSTLVTDLLTLARLESEEGVLESKPLDLREPIMNSVRAILPADEDAGVEVSIELPEQPVVVRGDEQALRMITSNLLDNAIKYTPRGGHVWVRLRAENGTGVIEVQDTGIGIDPAEQDRIFERFYRVDKARSRELGGTGLGLSIVKHVCLVHRGEVTVESQRGEGSVFRVKLPLA